MHDSDALRIRNGAGARLCSLVASLTRQRARPRPIVHLVWRWSASRGDVPLTSPARSWGRFPLYSRPDGRNGFGTRAADLNKVSLNRSTRFVVCFYHADFLANAECVQSRNHAFCLVSGGPSLSQPEGKKKEKVSPVACILSLSLCVCVCVCALCSVHCSLHKYMLMMII